MARERWIDVDSPTEWRSALAGIEHSFAHTWEYCRAMQSQSARPVFLYEVETIAGRFVCPIEQRAFDETTDVVTPQGFSGFVGVGEARRLTEHWTEAARARGYVSGYLVQNPALSSSAAFAGGDVSHDKSVYVWDLARSMQELYGRLDANRRRQLRHWQTLGPSLITDRPRLASFFRDNYEQFFQRRHATSTYGLSEVSIVALSQLENVYMVGIEQDGELAAASMFGYTFSGADYLFNISLPEGRHQSAVLLWAGAVHLKTLEVPHLNLGGGLVEGDGIANFKIRFGAIAVPLPVLKQVYDRPKYVELCRRVGVDGDDAGGYFPAYRRLASQPREVSPRQVEEP